MSDRPAEGRPRGGRGGRAEFEIGSPGEADNARLATLCGPLDANLAQIGAAFGVRISRRNTVFSIEGPASPTREARAAVQALYLRAASPLAVEDVQLGLVELRSQTQAGTTGHDADASPVLHTRRVDLQGRTPRQREYLRNILAHDVSFGIGPAGTGKTYLAVACAVDALERDAVKRIVLTRPAVEAGERLGFLPGDLAQKVDPYLRPLYDALYDLLGFERTARMFDRQAIEIAPLAYMRGRTLNHAFIILDEAQNTTPEQMKMFLTRIGFGSRAVVTGDATQIDLPKGQASGLIEARRVLSEVRGIAFTHFDSTDVVRHPLVARIVEAYERHAPPQR
ncbi:MAG: PhoH family protein [Betaproteobacteria bacterium]